MRLLLTATCAALICVAPLLAAAHSHGHGGGHGHRGARDRSSIWPRERERDYIPVEPIPLSVRCGYRLRDWRGRYIRCSAARAAFERDNPCPSTGEPQGACPGYVVDHVVPLKRGGADLPSNMQWQTVEEAKAKDRIE
jgi:hypothetical protein